MANCAVVQLSDGLVVNKIVADPNDLAPIGTQLVIIPDGVMCNAGWTWNGKDFVDPNPPQVDASE